MDVPVGECIYCRGGGVPGRLTLEHIIRESLGGMLELPEASCHDCQAITGAFEGEDAGKLFRPIRRQLNFPSKSRGKARSEQRERETFVIKFDGIKRDIPVAEYPGLIISFVFTLPTIMLGMQQQGRVLAVVFRSRYCLSSVKGSTHFGQNTVIGWSFRPGGALRLLADCWRSWLPSHPGSQSGGDIPVAGSLGARDD